MFKRIVHNKPPRPNLPRTCSFGGMNSLLIGSLVLVAWISTDLRQTTSVTTEDSIASLPPPEPILAPTESERSGQPQATAPLAAIPSAAPSAVPTTAPSAIPSTTTRHLSFPSAIRRRVTYSITVSRGDTLSRLFKQHGISTDEAYQVANLPDARMLNTIRPGDTLEVEVNATGQLIGLNYPLAIDRDLVIRRLPDDGFAAEERVRPTIRAEHLAEGMIRTTLYQDGRKAGLSKGMLQQLQLVFGGQIDFNRDLHPGDIFRVFYDTHELDGKHLRDGHLLAAEMVLQGSLLRAFRYVDEAGNAGYYDADGNSVETAFQRSPLPLARVSSGYSSRRFHPILKVWRRHEGVDYAAPRGTPVSATGQGLVEYVGWQRGYGKVVILRHANGYSTLYGHLSRFAKDLKSGQRVSRGETIAYVGSTGWSTGPHLHYEFRENGRHKDPQSISLPPAKPVPDDERPAFSAAVEGYLASLNSDPDAARTLALRSADER